MKIIRAWLLLAMLASGGLALGGAVPKEKAKPAPAGAQVPPAAQEKKDEEPGQVDGIELSRPGGGFLGLQIVNNKFVLSFYDAKKKKTPADCTRASLRWPVKYQPSDERTVLNPGGDGTSLSSGKVVRPPHRFKVFMALYVDDREEPVESHTVDYRE